MIFLDDVKSISITGVRINRDIIVPLILLGMVFFVRLLVVSQNTIFYDEAVNITLGSEALNGDFTQDATTWIFGSYIYPFAVGAAYKVGGDFGVRLLTALLSTVTVGLVYSITRNLFSQNSALWSLLLFGLSGSSINIGQLAVYDSLAIPLMALSLYAVLKAALEREPRSYRFLILAGIAASLSVLVKYIGLLFLPALGFALVMFFYRRKRSFLSFVCYIAPIAFVLLSYFVLNYDALLNLVQNQKVLLFVPSIRGQIVRTIFVESGFLLLLALLGILVMPLPGNMQASLINHLKFRLPFLLLIALAYIAPAYQVITQNIQSLWKHLIYSSLYLSPFAGYGLSFFVYQFRNYRGRWGPYIRIASMLIMVALLSWYVQNALDRNWGFLHSWPNVEGAVAFLEKYGIDNDTRILAEESAVYEYYFDLGAYDRDVWSNTFYLEYRDAKGVEGMQYGIRDKYFDLVILDDYYTRDTNNLLRQTLAENGYELVYVDPDPQILSTGESISIEIFASR